MKIEKTLITIFLFCTILTVGACSDGSGNSPGILDDGDNSSSPSSLNNQFLVNNAARESVTVTDSGLQYEVLRSTNGPMPSADSTVTVHYLGELIDGTEFDSSYSRGEPATFPLGSTIPGWIEGVQLMNVGSQFRFVMPPDLAYGDAGAGTAIAPDSILIFEIDLLEINAN